MIERTTIETISISCYLYLHVLILMEEDCITSLTLTCERNLGNDRQEAYTKTSCATHDNVCGGVVAFFFEFVLPST